MQKTLEQSKTYSDLEQKLLKDFYLFHKTGLLFFFLTRLNSELIFLFSHRIVPKYVKTLMYLFIFISSVVGFINIALQ